MGKILAPDRTGRPGDTLGWGRRRPGFEYFVRRKNICTQKMGLEKKI